jgi:hypothetical protein
MPEASSFKNQVETFSGTFGTSSGIDLVPDSGPTAGKNRSQAFQHFESCGITSFMDSKGRTSPQAFQQLRPRTLPESSPGKYFSHVIQWLPFISDH